MSWYKDVELLRAYMRAGIVMFFMMCLYSVLRNHVSTGPMDISNLISNMDHLRAVERDRAFTLIENATAGQIPAGNVWSWLTGLVAGTLVIYYFGEKVTGTTTRRKNTNTE